MPYLSQNRGFERRNISFSKEIEGASESPCRLELTNKRLSDPEWSYNHLFEVETLSNECPPSGSESFPLTCSGNSSLSQVGRFHSFWGLGTSD